MYILIFWGSWSALYNIINFGNKIELPNVTTIQMVSISFIILTIIFFLAYILEKIRKFFFPSIVFYWGSEIERFDKNMKYADKIFWGIIVAFFIPMILKLLL